MDKTSPLPLAVGDRPEDEDGLVPLVVFCLLLRLALGLHFLLAACTLRRVQCGWSDCLSPVASELRPRGGEEETAETGGESFNLQEAV